MRWPWQRKQEPASSPPPAPEPVVPEPALDVEAIIAATAEATAARVRQETIEEISRAWISSSPMPGAPESGGGSLYPLYAYDNPIWFSTPQAPTRRPGTTITIQTMRLLAETYDILRACIQHLKREVSAVPIKIVAKNTKDASPKTQARIQEATAFFSKKGGIGGVGRRRSHFESEIIEDVCVIGAAAIFVHPNRAGGIFEAVAVDAATIRPRVDAFGWPGPGEAAYEQWIQGMLIAGFTREQLVYDGLFPKSYTPFFSSPIEWLINVVNSALRADDWNRRWLTDGSSVHDVYALPETWTPDQIRSWATYWDAMKAGDSGARQKTGFVPSGTQKVGNNTRKDQDFQAFELWLMRRTCAIMGVQPASIGFAGEQYKVSQSDSIQLTSDFGVGVLLDFRKATYDDLLERNGYDELEVANVTGQEEEAGERAIRLVSLVNGGILTPNEARAEEGKDPIPEADELLVLATLRPLLQAMAPPPDPMAANMKGTGQNAGDNRGADHPSGGDAAGDADVRKRAALAQWERKAVGRYKAGKGAQTPFETGDVPLAVREHIERRLNGCTSLAAVKALFRDAAALDEDEAEERTQWAQRVASELEALKAHATTAR